MTGSGGGAIAEQIGAKFVQEVTAVSLAVEKLHPEVYSVIELGGQDAKIIVFSGFSTARVAEGAIDLGAIRYLTKGADPEVINDAIEEVAAEGKLSAPMSAPSLLHRPTT